MSLPPIRQYLDALNQHRLQIAPALRKHLNGREKWLKALSDSAKTNIPKEHAKAKATGKTKVKAKANAKAKANTPTMIGIPQDVRHMCDEFESDSNRLHAQAKAATGSLPTNLGSAWLTKLDLAQEAHRKLLNDSVTAADNWTLMQADAAGEHYDLIDAALRELNALEEVKERGIETRSKGADTESKAPKIPASDPAHSEDFTSVNWYGTKYFFKKGLQAESVRILWDEWKKGTPCLSEKTIGDKAGSGNDRFRLQHVFKPKNHRSGKREAHPAWDRMIKSVGKGYFALSHP